MTPIATSGGAAGTAATSPGELKAPVVRLAGATARWGSRVIWEAVDIEIGPGEFVAILGPNGVGKSTMIKVILGLFPLAAGTASILGRPPGRANHEIGYLPQRRNFDAGLRVRGVDVVRLGLEGDRWGVPLPGLARFSQARRRANERIEAVIDLVGAAAFATRPIGQMSGGEQQRLLIAQALVREPRLLVLDEPLDSLDLPNQAASAALLERICRESRVTVLLVAHNVNPILAYLDRVIYLAKGGVASGTPDEVINPETLTRLYGTPIEVFRTADGHPVVVGQPEPAHGDAHAHTLR